MTAFSIKHPWLTILLFLILTVVIGYGAVNLRFSDDIRVFFDKENPELLAYDKLEATFSRTNSILFVMAPADGNMFSTDSIAAMQALTAAAWTLPYSRRVDSLTNFQYTYAENDDLVVTPLGDMPLEAIGRIALSEPLLLNRLSAADGAVAGANVVIALPGKNPLAEQPEVVNAAREIAAAIETQYPGHSVYLTGLVMINNAMAEEGRKDMETLVPVMIVVIMVLMMLLLRSIAGAVATLIVILASIGISMGFAGWLGLELSPPVLSAINIIMTLAIADSVHILSSFQHAWRDTPDRGLAMQESLRVNFMPVMVTSLTTALGFMTMHFSESPPFRVLGYIVACGVLAAWLASMTLLPALTILLSRKNPSKVKQESALMGHLSRFIIARRKLLLGLVGTFAVIVAFGLPKNDTNDEFVSYFDESTSFRIATDFSIKHLTGFEFFEYSLDCGSAGCISEPDYLQNIDAFAVWLRQQPEVRHVYSHGDVMKRLNKNMHNDAEEFYRLPEDRETAAQYLLLYELSLPFGLDLTDNLNIDKSSTRMRVSLDSITSHSILQLEARARQWLDAHVSHFETEATGQTPMFARIGSRNIQSLLTSSVGALVLISFILMFVLRSFKFGLVSLIPNLLPAVLAFGLWGYVVGQVGLGLAVVVGMTLGIVVDDTVHLMSKYLAARREQGLSAEQAVAYALARVGEPMILTSIILIAGFGILATSNFELNAGMATLSAVTISMALLADLFFLAPLLITLEKKHDAS